MRDKVGRNATDSLRDADGVFVTRLEGVSLPSLFDSHGLTVWAPRTFATAAHSLAALRSNEHGVDVQVLTSHVDAYSPALAAGDVRLIEPDADDPTYLDWAHQVAREHDVDVIWPSRRLGAWADAAGRFGATGTAVLTCSSAAHGLAESKSGVYRLAAGGGVPVPPHRLVRTVDEARAAVASLGRDARHGLLVKPDCGQGAEGVYRLVDVREALPVPGTVDRDGWLEHLRTAAGARPWLVMPFLPGAEHSVDLSLDRDGGLRAAAVRTKSDTHRGQVVRHDAHLVRLSHEVARAVGAGPLANVQWREDDDGAPVLLEINVRAAAGMYVSSRALGFDLLWDAIARAVGLPVAADGPALVAEPQVFTSVPDMVPIAPVVPVPAQCVLAS